MHNALITIVLAIAVVLIHFALVDFRFRYRDGMIWYWRLNPAPPLMWVGRVLIIAAVIAALCVGAFGATTTVLIVLGSLLVLHIMSLILLEVLEPR